MQNLYKSRYTLLLVIIVLYLLPILLLSSYGKLYMPPQKGWNLLAFGLFSSVLGTLGLFWMLCKLAQEENYNEELPTEASEEALKPVNNSVEADTFQTKALEELQSHYSAIHEQSLRTQAELENKNEELQRLQHDYQSLQQQLEVTNEEYNGDKQSFQNELEKQKKILADSQKTISEQREGIDKKLQQIAQLETKVSDLTYEIKTLIQLAEIENQSMPIYKSHPIENSIQGNSPDIEMNDDGHVPCLFEKQIRTETQAAIQLKRCIDIAQKITGANHYNNGNSRFKDLAVDNYTLDLRRLFDSLRMENASVIVFYSQKENKVLFVNNQSKHLLGWSPDKFVQSFNEIIDSSKDAWKQGISSLAIKNDAHVSLKMKSKAGPQEAVNALLGIIPTGIFRHHVLGVFYQNESR